MIRHIVLFKVRAEVAADQFQVLMQEIADLRSSHSGILSFEHGPNQTPETRDHGYTYGFTLTLGSWADLETYQNDPIHRATGAKLILACDPDHSSILAFDMEVEDKR